MSTILSEGLDAVRTGGRGTWEGVTGLADGPVSLRAGAGRVAAAGGSIAGAAGGAVCGTATMGTGAIRPA